MKIPSPFIELTDLLTFAPSVYQKYIYLRRWIISLKRCRNQIETRCRKSPIHIATSTHEVLLTKGWGGVDGCHGGQGEVKTGVEQRGNLTSWMSSSTGWVDREGNAGGKVKKCGSDWVTDSRRTNPNWGPREEGLLKGVGLSKTVLLLRAVFFS